MHKNSMSLFHFFHAWWSNDEMVFILAIEILGSQGLSLNEQLSILFFESFYLIFGLQLMFSQLLGMLAFNCFQVLASLCLLVNNLQIVSSLQILLVLAIFVDQCLHLSLVGSLALTKCL